MTARKERDTAVHEAGHFVAGERLGLQTTVISIDPDYERGTWGHCGQEDSHRSAAEGQDQVTALCAGYAAVIVAGKPEGQAVLGCGDDFEKAEEIIAFWGLPSLEEQKAKAVELMREERNRRAVEIVAAELLATRRIDGQWGPVLIDYADGEISDAELAQSRALFESAGS